MKKHISILLVLAVLFSLSLYGCGDTKTKQETSVPDTATSTVQQTAQEEGPVSPAGVFPITKEKITLTAFLGGYDPKLDFNKNYFLNLMEEKTNIHIDVKYAAMNEESETKKQLLFSSGDYPDIFLFDNFSCITFSQALNYGAKEKMIIPINDLYEKYGYDLKKAWDAKPEYKKIVTAPDGNIYGFQQITEAPHISADPKLFVNTQWMKKLGMSMPETLDQFRDLLRAFKQKDPGGIGSKNVIPMSSHTLCMFGTAVVESFIPTDMLLMPGAGSVFIGKFIAADKDNKVVFAADKDEFKAALTYLHDMYAEGLLDPAGFTNNFDQCVQLSSTKKVGIFEVQNLWCLNTADKDTYSNYRVMPVFSGPTGLKVQATLPMIDWQNKFYAVITDKCKYPEAAFRWMDLCFNQEMAIYKWQGKENVTWRKPTADEKNVDGGPISFVALTPSKDVDTSNDTMHSGPQNGMWDTTLGVQMRPIVSEDLLYSDPAYCETRSYLDTKILEPFLMKCVPSDMYMAEDETVELGKIRTDLCQYVAKSYVEFITGAKDINKDWDAYLANLKKLKSDRYVELYQKAFDLYNNAK